MSLQVKFGQHLIFKENLQNISEEIRKNEWTDNKIYKSAYYVDIKPSFECKNNYGRQDEALQNIMATLKNKKDVLEKIGNVYFSKNVNNEKSKNFTEYKKDLINSYFDNKIIPKKRNLLNLTKTLSDFPNVDKSDIEQVSNFDSEEIAKFKNSKLLDIIKKYKLNFLLSYEYKNLPQYEKNNLMAFLQKEEKKKSGVHDINDFYFDLTDTNKVVLKDINGPKENKHPMDSIFQPYENIQVSNSSQKNDSDLMISRVVMFNDFRSMVKNKTLSDEQIMKYFNQTQNLEKAAELYFRDLYGSTKLRVVYVMPDKNQYSMEFNLTSSPEDLFMALYSKFPDMVEPKLFRTDNTQIVIDPVNDKFIGGLIIPQNSFILVRL